MFKRLLMPIKISLVIVIGLVFIGVALSAENELAGNVPVDVQQTVPAQLEAPGLTSELEGLTKLLTARSEEQGGALQQSPGVKSLLQLLKAGLEVQQRMTRALPQDLRERVERFFAQYADFVARIHVPDAICKLGIEVQRTLGNDVKDGEAPSLTALRRSLNFGMNALQAGGWGEMFDKMSINHKNDVREMLGDMFAGAVLGGHTSLAGVAIGGNKQNPRLQDLADDEFDEDDVYDLIDLQELVAALNAAEADFNAAFPEATCFSNFKDYVQGIASENINTLANVAFVYLEPVYLAVSRELFDIQEILFTLFEESIGRAPTATSPAFESETKRDRVGRVMDAMDGVLNQEDSQILYGNNPYYYWLSSLKRHEGSCTSYAFIKRRFKKEGVGKEYFQMFRLYAHAYTFAHHCLNIYYDEVARTVPTASAFNTFNLVPTLLNYALTSTVAANYFFNVQEVARNSVYYDSLMHKSSITDMRTQMRAFVADYIGIAAAAPTAMGSPLKGLAVHSTLRTKVEKLAASWVYYHLFYNGLFNRNAFFRPNDAAGNPVPDKGVFSLWPTDFGVFRKALLGTIDYSVDFLSLVAEASCYRSLDPDLAADVSDVTLGIVNPGAIKYVFRAFLPMVMMGSAGNLLKLQPNSVEAYFMTRKENWLSSWLECFFGAGNGVRDLAWYRNTAAQNGMTSAGLYAESELVDYAACELGYNAGYWLGGAAHKEIWSGASKVFRGLVKAGDVIGIGLGDSQEMIDVMNFAMASIAKMAVDYVKMFIWPTQELEQMIEPFVRGYLLNHGYLSVDDDRTAYREAVVNMILTQLAIQGLIGRYDAALYAREFKKNPSMDTVDIICKKIAEDFKKHLVCMGTGKLGSIIFSWAGDKAYMQYGPITPRIRNLFV